MLKEIMVNTYLKYYRTVQKIEFMLKVQWVYVERRMEGVYI